MIYRSLNNFLWFLSSQFFHGRVIVFLRFGEKHFQHSSFILYKSDENRMNIYIIKYVQSAQLLNTLITYRHK